MSTDGAASFTPSAPISAGTSNAHDSGNGIDDGDYSGLSFYGGVTHPVWSDNSNSTGTNPDGALHNSTSIPPPFQCRSHPSCRTTLCSTVPARLSRTSCAAAVQLMGGNPHTKDVAA